MSIPMNDVTTALRENLSRFRELRKLTQAELGKRAGFAAASISHFETGQRVPSLESLVKLADALDVSLDALIGRESAETGSQIDPIFLRASRASADKLDAVRRVTAALLGEDVKP
jgi:transcriptional regulator with XRE-family HTH domain